jgi:hypothetical protein
MPFITWERLERYQEREVFNDRSISYMRFEVITATLMMKAASASETPVNFYQTILRNKPEYRPHPMLCFS